MSHGHHVHGMLPKGLQILEELLPGFTQRVRSAGGLGDDLIVATARFPGRRSSSG